MYAPAFSPSWPSANYHSGFCIVSSFGIHDFGIQKFGIQYSVGIWDFVIKSNSRLSNSAVSPILGSSIRHSVHSGWGFRGLGFRRSGIGIQEFGIMFFTHWISEPPRPTPNDDILDLPAAYSLVWLSFKQFRMWHSPHFTPRLHPITLLHRYFSLGYCIHSFSVSGCLFCV